MRAKTLCQIQSAGQWRVNSGIHYNMANALHDVILNLKFTGFGSMFSKIGLHLLVGIFLCSLCVQTKILKIIRPCSCAPNANIL